MGLIVIHAQGKARGFNVALYPCAADFGGKVRKLEDEAVAVLRQRNTISLEPVPNAPIGAGDARNANNIGD